jgi:hypothetical protein
MDLAIGMEVTQGAGESKLTQRLSAESRKSRNAA